MSTPLCSISKKTNTILPKENIQIAYASKFLKFLNALRDWTLQTIIHYHIEDIII